MEYNLIRRYKDYKGPKADPRFKQTVILCAEQNGNRVASERYGVPYSTLRRWRRFREDIFGDDDEYVPHNKKFLRFGKARMVMKRMMSRTAATSTAVKTEKEEKDSDEDSIPLQERLRESTRSSSPNKQTINKPLLSPSAVKSPQQQQQQQQKPAENGMPPKQQEKDPDEVCLRWNSHHNNMKNAFPSLLEKEQYVDVTLCSEGQTIRCHRLILSSCSAYFDEILSGITPLQHPVIFLKGTPFWILKSLIDFMYVGEVHIEQAKLQEILEVAEVLKIKGLTGKTQTPKKETKEEPNKTPSEPPPLVATANTKPQRAVPPLRLAVTKEQAASMQTVDPLSLLKPSFYEETGPIKRSPIIIRPKLHHQSLAEFSAKQKDWLSKKIAPKKRLKRKSTDHDPSPPPIILRKGTKSRPIVKAPKYYHMEYEEKEGKVKLENEEDGEANNEETDKSNKPPAAPAPTVTTPTTAASEPTFDITNVKSEPVDVDIEENDVEYEQQAAESEENAFIMPANNSDTFEEPRENFDSNNEANPEDTSNNKDKEPDNNMEIEQDPLSNEPVANEHSDKVVADDKQETPTETDSHG